MSMSPGTKLGVYKLLEPIGKGGMGEVYRARDTKLDRDVAIKVLPEELAHDQERVERFEREAKLLAALNHANIATLHDLEESDGKSYLVMELVDGETLAERIERGPIGVDETIRLARQIATGLEAAHDKGVIHRDLKPANIKVTADGQIKILDFGLAKAFMDDAGQSADTSLSPTLTKGTVVGAIMGTAAYMSPEQARGKTVDKRTDVWAFGAVLYEMLTGARAFDGSDASEILAGVIKSEPSWERLPKDMPPALARFLRRSLEKDPKERVRDIGDVRLALAGAFESEGKESMPSRSLVPWAVAGTALVLAIVSVFTRDTVSPNQVPARFVIPVDGELAVRNGTLVAISPDGQDLVYSAITDEGDQLYHRPVNRLEAEALPGTAEARTPFFSPDGEWVAFISREGDLQKTRLSGGLPTTICACNADIHGAWSADGTVVFGDLVTGRLMRISSDGGDPEPITTLLDGEVWHGVPAFTPNGEAVAFTVWLGSLENAQLGVVSLATGEERRLGDGFFPRFASPGHLMYGRAGAIWAVSFDAVRLTLTGEPVEVLPGVRIEAAGAVQFSLTGNGTAVYIADASNRTARALVWVDRDGREEPVSIPDRNFQSVAISPDGTRIVLEILGSGLEDLWLYDVAAKRASQLTFDVVDDLWPVWTPHGERVLFESPRGGPYALYSKRTDGTGQAQHVAELNGQHRIWSLTPDGETLAYARATPETGWDVYILTLGNEPSHEPLLAGDFQETNPQISPDGRFLAYVSDESGERQVYVSPFPNVDGKWRVSRDGGIEPIWSRDGRELFYRDGYDVFAVPIDTSSAFVHGEPKLLFTGRYYRTSLWGGHTYDVMPDGQRFVMIRESEEDTGSEIIVIQNWLEEVARLAPTDN